MKRILLLFVLLSTTVGFSQTFNQPSQFNNVCDDNNDGSATFYMQEISYEILSGFSANDYTVTHHLTQSDAAAGANSLPNVYVNNTNPQLIFARIVNNTSGQVQIITYNLNVNPTPIVTNQTITACFINGSSLASFDLYSAIPMFTNGNQNLNATFHQTQTEAFTNTNMLNSPFVSGQNTLFVRVEDITTGCFSVSQLILIPITCGTTSCNTPTQVYTTSVTQNSAVVDWTETGTATQWEIAVSINGVAATTVTATTHPFVLTGLTCGTFYSVAVRSICSPTELSSYTTNVPLTTLSCTNPTSSCGSTFTDSGTAAGNYANNENTTSIFCPDNATDVVTITFTAFNLENNFDFLRVYDGTSANAPLLGSFTGTTLPSAISSSIAGGCLTVVFTSDGTVTSTGWEANITCSTAPTCFKPINVFTASVAETSVALGWTETGTATQWEIAVLPCGSTPTATTSWISVSTNPFVVSNLTPNTCYAFFVRSICSPSDVSLPSSGVNATTLSIPPVCGGIFTDPAGATSNYANNTDYTVTICPSNPGEMVTVTFTEFNTEANWDGLYVYNGNSTSSPQIASTNGSGNVPGGVAGSYWGTTIPGPFTSSSPDGCLTFRFRSDTSVTATGWVANVTCNAAPDRLLLIAFVDLNNNNIKDANENYFNYGSYVSQLNNSGVNTYVNSTAGYYDIYDTNPLNTYDVSFELDPQYASYYAVGTTNFNDINIPLGSGTTTLYFPVTVLQNYSDVAINIVPMSQPVPGFTYWNKIVYTNFGTTSASGDITFVKDANVTIANVSQSGIVNNASGFTYAYTNLLPYETRTIYVAMSVPTIPTVNLNDIITNSATITAGVNEVNLLNNTSTASQIVVGSYDPNDKMESHGEKILISNFTADDYLYYTIRFENTGTANATNVIVNDVLDAQLDETSVRMVDASHSYILRRNNSQLSWTFENIDLPVSIPNTMLGKGYITFKVKPKAGYAVGDIIPNTASIFFDSNPAIVTNTFNTEFVSVLGVNQFENNNFVFYPNPTNDFITISSKDSETINAIKVYDLLGKTIYFDTYKNITSQTIDLSGVNSGMYFIEVKTNNNLIVKKIIVN